MSLATARTIDIHAHAVLEGTFGLAGSYGPELYEGKDGTPVFRIGDYKLRGVRYAGSAFMDSEVRIAAMDSAGIDWQLLSPNPLTYFHHIEPENAIAYSQRHNDELASVVARHPDRLGATANLPMTDISAAIAELERAIGELNMLGAYIGTELTIPLNHPTLDPFYARLVELDVPLFIHPAPAGIDGPKSVPQLMQFELDILCGFTMQETVALATLIFGGVLHRHPKLDICISHGGGAIAMMYGRLKHAIHKRNWVPGFLRDDPQAFDVMLGRFWYDIHMHDDRALDLLIERVGTEQLVYGTNFAGWDQPDSIIAPTQGISLADNARRLLRSS